jgi:hypothetical protein
MSLHEIFDAVWNAEIPWMWIFGVFFIVVLVLIIVAGFVANEIRKVRRNVQKP